MVTPSIPLILQGDGWMNTRDLAKEFNRSIRTIQKWLTDQTLIDFGYTVYRDPKGRYLVRLRSK